MVTVCPTCATRDLGSVFFFLTTRTWCSYFDQKPQYAMISGVRAIPTHQEDQSFH